MLQYNNYCNQSITEFLIIDKSGYLIGRAPLLVCYHDNCDNDELSPPGRCREVFVVLQSRGLPPIPAGKCEINIKLQRTLCYYLCDT